MDEQAPASNDQRYDQPEYLESPQEGALSRLEANAELSKKVADEVGIDEKKAEKAVRLIQESYSGPIPFAAELARYNEVSPGLGTDIARDYLKGREHERECDKKAITLAERDADRKDRWLQYANRGQTFGMLSQLVFVGGVFVALYVHAYVIAGMFLAAPAIGIVGQFIKGTGHRETKPTRPENAEPESSDPEPRPKSDNQRPDEY